MELITHTRNYDQLQQVCEKKDYKFFDGLYNLNLIGERTNDQYTNGFTDLIHLALEGPQGPEMYTFRWTTKPGIYGEGAVLYPKWINGIFGTFCLCPGQYLAAYQMMNVELMAYYLKKYQDIKGSPWAMPYLQQVGELKGWRDGNMDLEITKDVIDIGTDFGVNIHYMGADQTPKIIKDDNLNNWSLGCQGAPNYEWFKIASLFFKILPYQGPTLSYTLLESKDFDLIA